MAARSDITPWVTSVFDAHLTASSGALSTPDNASDLAHSILMEVFHHESQSVTSTSDITTLPNADHQHDQKEL
jgi:capsular polysaccharide biosynthesis protein